jgi:methionyl-tRNA formyltransferase
VDVGVRAGTAKVEWGALLVGCTPGTLRLDLVQPPGGKPMPVEAYLRGHKPPTLA